MKWNMKKIGAGLGLFTIFGAHLVGDINKDVEIDNDVNAGLYQSLDDDHDKKQKAKGNPDPNKDKDGKTPEPDEKEEKAEVEVEKPTTVRKTTVRQTSNPQEVPQEEKIDVIKETEKVDVVVKANENVQENHEEVKSNTDFEFKGAAVTNTQEGKKQLEEAEKKIEVKIEEEKPQINNKVDFHQETNTGFVSESDLKAAAEEMKITNVERKEVIELQEDKKEPDLTPQTTTPTEKDEKVADEVEKTKEDKDIAIMEFD